MECKLDKKLAELLGVMFGDGCLSTSGAKHLVYISGHKIDDFEYHSINTKPLFKEVFNKDVNINFRKEENTLFIRFSDKKIFDVFRYFGMPIGHKYAFLKVPRRLNKKQLFNAFLRGLFDTDGCVVLSKQHKKIPYYPRLEIASKSNNLLLELLSTLQKQGFYGSVSKKARHFRLEIPGFRNLELWMKTIGFNNPKHKNKVYRINSQIPKPIKNFVF